MMSLHDEKNKHKKPPKTVSLHCFKVKFFFKDSPDSSVGEEFACNAGDPGLIPGSGKSIGEGIGYPLQYSWASLVP